MTAVNNFLPFATGAGANVETQTNYAADPDLPIGNQPGVASSAFNNKALRQGNFVVSQLAQVISDTLAASTLDDGINANMYSQIKCALLPVIPIVQTFITGSGTWNNTYVYFTDSCNATLGATYTNNGHTYTVAATVASSLVVQMRGSAAPLTSGTLTLATGSGDATITFRAVRSAIYLSIRMVGGGAGGVGSGTSSTMGAGTAGTNSTFGTSLLIAQGGSPGVANGQSGGGGGNVTINSPATGFPLIGAQGGAGQYTGSATGIQLGGGYGGSTPIGPGGPGAGNTAGGSPSANTGAGGAGGGSNGTTQFIGAGGGSGGYISANISSPSATYSYSVGAHGLGGNAGSGGTTGGIGADGYIEVVEHFQ